MLSNILNINMPRNNLVVSFATQFSFNFISVEHEKNIKRWSGSFEVNFLKILDDSFKKAATVELTVN
jgi:hypothetical protein